MRRFYPIARHIKTAKSDFIDLGMILSENRKTTFQDHA
jgi:hypothetical protein